MEPFASSSASASEEDEEEAHKCVRCDASCSNHHPQPSTSATAPADMGTKKLPGNVVLARRPSNKLDDATQTSFVPLHRSNTRSCDRRSTSFPVYYSLMLMCLLIFAQLVSANSNKYSRAMSIEPDPSVLATFRDVHDGKEVELEKMVGFYDCFHKEKLWLIVANYDHKLWLIMANYG